MTTTLSLVAPGTCRIWTAPRGGYRVLWCDTRGIHGRSKWLDTHEKALAHAKVLDELCGYRLDES